jgi:hypothetical protein
MRVRVWSVAKIKTVKFPLHYKQQVVGCKKLAEV